MDKLFSFTLDRLQSSLNQKQLYRMVSNTNNGNFPGVEVGTRGGLVEKPGNIHNSWIEDGAMVTGNAVVSNCNVRKNVYVRDNVNIIGNGCYLGGNGGPIIIGGSVILDMCKPIDCGPITIFGDNIAITGDNDIISICGLFKNMGYNTHLTFYKPRGGTDILCYGCYLDGTIQLEELPLALYKELTDIFAVDEEEVSGDDATKLMHTSMDLVRMIRHQLG